ncbi:alpha-1,6-mannosyltransferase subunit [Pyronema domesticum]|nr:alpha-1,6-mannosyltransferase subunit [Pyronema domesticum]
MGFLGLFPSSCPQFPPPPSLRTTDYLLPLAVTLGHLAIAPYTKVEESFSLQATHDILHYGLPTSNITSYLTTHYDHLTFPGAVPRSFLGPLVLAYISTPFIHLLRGHVSEQLIVRGTLALLSSLALGFYTTRIRRIKGPVVARFYQLLQLTQFHIPFYASRTLPNTFALILTLLADAGLISGTYTSQSMALGLMTFTAVAIRSEVALLLAFQALTLFLTRRLPLRHIIISGLLGGIIGLISTIAVDSYFWLSSSPSTPFTTPFLSQLGFIWPEFSAFYFNTILSGASLWGESPWHYYFTSSLPKLCLNPLTQPLIFISGSLAPFPHLLFIAAYSVLVKHKEWRFIVYSIPTLTTAAAEGAAWVWNRRGKSAAYMLLTLATVGSIAATAAAAAGMAAVSAQNYPGGVALHSLQGLVQKGERVHLDTLTCMTGASRFLQDELPGVSWDKTEDEETKLSPEFWEGVDWAVTESPERVPGAWKVETVVKGFDGARVYKPGQPTGTEGERAVKRLGLMGKVEGLEDRLRPLMKGWWVGIKMKEQVWIMRRQKDTVVEEV